MKVIRIVNERTGDELAGDARLADSFADRCRGLIGRKLLLPGEGLIIRPCKMVHMFFMTFPIDVVFCDRENRVISIQENLQPWKLSRYEPDAKFVIEVPVGMCRKAGLAAGDFVELEEGEDT